MSGAAADQTLGVDLVPVVISSYLHHPDLAQAEVEARAIAELLTDHLDAVAITWAEGRERTETAVKEQLRTWADRRDGRSSILLWLGHGTSDGNDAWLATYETPPKIRYNGINTTTVAEQIAHEWGRRRDQPGIWAAVVIEACGAGTFVRKVAAALYAIPNGPHRLALIGVGADDGAANLGRFRRELTAALESYTDNDEEIRPEDLVSNLRSRIEPVEVVDRGLHKARTVRRRRLLPTKVTAPMDLYEELRTFLSNLPADERGHYIPKAQGGEHGELAWYFVGRQDERQEIAAWLHSNNSGMLVVTGPPGSGKSALLGNVLVYTKPALRDLLVRAGHLEPAEATMQLPAEPFDCVVHLAGLTVSEVVTRLARAAGLGPPTRRIDASGDADWLLDGLRARKRSFTVLADALDEAQEPATIASSVLRRIAALPKVRVLIGTRSSTKVDPDRPTETEDDLLDALGRATTTRVMTIDRDQKAISTYVRQRLEAARAARVVRASDGRIATVAKRISGPDRQFLFARLAVHEILARPQLLNPRRSRDLTDLLGADHRALFRAAVRRLTATVPAFSPLLEALALAKGRGLPRADRIWETIANALAPPGVRVNESHIDDLLSRAAPYVMLDAEDGQSVYRLAHRTFQDHFLTPGTSHHESRA
jgi:hypothetical protein